MRFKKWIEERTMHNHDNDIKDAGKKLIWSVVLNLSVTAIQLAGGFLSGSLSIITDALHNFTDTVSLIISLVAFNLEKEGRSDKRTFGHKRAGVMAAFLNSILLMIVSLFLIKEAVFRLLHPVAIKSVFVVVIALIGMMVNFLCAFWLRGHSHNDMNIRSAFLHLFADALVSVSVFIGGISMYFFHTFWVDAVLAIIIGGYIIKLAVSVFLDALDVLMLYSPKGVSLEAVRRDIQQIPGVKDVHHIHMWSLTPKDIHFEAHINLDEDLKVSQTKETKEALDRLLKGKYGINHSTFQFEYEGCG